MSKLKFDTVIFDLDGTLFDTERIGLKAWDEGSKLFGLIIPPKILKSTVGHPVEQRMEIIEKHIGPIANREVYLEKIEAMYFSMIFSSNLLKEGAIDLLIYLKNNNKNLGLATSSNLDKTRKLLKISNIQNYFDAIVTSESIHFNKPNPAIYLKCLEVLESDSINCIGIEDSENGGKASIDAGIRTILIPDISTFSERTLNKAFLVLPSLPDLLSYLKNTSYQ